MIYDAYGTILYDPASSENNPFAGAAFQKPVYTSDVQIQGCCSDGTFLYFGNSSFMSKLNPLTGEITTKSGLSLGHCNDITYNPTTGKIYIATMASGRIDVLNPSTLEVESSFVPEDGEGNPVSSSGIAYDRNGDRFILSNSHTYYIFDGAWTFERSFTYTTTGWTYQGLETDGEYIFRPLYSASSNKILVLDFTGEAVKMIDTNYNAGYEIEGVAYDWNGNWYDNYLYEVHYLGIHKFTNYNAVWQMAQLNA